MRTRYLYIRPSILTTIFMYYTSNGLTVVLTLKSSSSSSIPLGHKNIFHTAGSLRPLVVYKAKGVYFKYINAHVQTKNQSPRLQNVQSSPLKTCCMKICISFFLQRSYFFFEQIISKLIKSTYY